MRQKIVLDADILRDQARSLDAHASALRTSAAQAQVSMPAQAFGRMNSYLPAPCNALAGKAGSLLTAASDLLDAMGVGVDGVLNSFATIEEQAAAKLNEFEP